MMRLCGVLLAAGAVLAAAADDKKDDAKDELKKLEGTWQVVAAEQGGAALPEKTLKDMKAVVKGDMLKIVIGEATFLEFKFTIDPAKKPKTIDATSTGEGDKGRQAPGIYELDGDSLKLCLGKANNRPTEFTGKKGSGCSLFVCKREKK
jgi:uncharacterized protein (TIGR03067 family)